MNSTAVYCNDANKSCTNRACGSRSPVDATGAYPRRSSPHEERVGVDREEQGADAQHRFNYGGRAENRDAVANSSPTRSRPTRSTKKRCALVCITRMPDPDLVIRTSGEYRISNFLLWEMAYSELVFTDVLWPDFRRENLFEAVEEYSNASDASGVSTNDHDQDDGRRRRPHLRVPVGALRQR